MDRKAQVVNAALAPETQRALKKHQTAYFNWCAAEGIPTEPKQEVIEAFFIHLLDKGLKRASLDQALWSLEALFADEAQTIFKTPEFKKFFSGLRRMLGFQQQAKRELTIEHIKQMKFAENLNGLRDRTILLLGFCAGLRRSELVAIEYKDLEFVSFGLRVNIRKSKTNQYGFKEHVDIPAAVDKSICPVKQVKLWLNQANITSSYIFRSFYKGGKLSPRKLSSHHIAVLAKKYIAQLDLDPKEFSGHSLRAGCATYLLHKGIPLNIVSKQLRHKRLDTTLKYDRNLAHNALRGLF